MIDLIKDFKIISIIGLEKNVGKTTTLNYIIEKTKGSFSLGLTSIGVDGETVDSVTFTEKPRIYVYKGTIVATARKSLAALDITKEIVNKTKINTAMGEIIIVKALSDGYVELAGPSVTKELEVASKYMLEAGATKIFIDGALSRKSLASPAVAEGTILATGAAVAKSMREVVERTVHIYELLSIPQVEEDIANLIDSFEEKLVIVGKDRKTVKSIDIPTSLDLGSEIFSELGEDTSYLCLKGAVTDKVVGSLIKHKSSKAILNLVVEDGTKLFINSENLKKLDAKGIRLMAKKKINIIAITLNPTSPYGYDFDGKIFKTKLMEKLKLPVYNVKELSRGGEYEISR